ncbi:MAG: HAMP domain-containing histidine kinase [Peptococcaceae bacterium]|nr:HAMP domain-containing histidine kinase [Peptococcaceae bacterium]
MAHEVRNPLAVVRGNLQILLWKEDLESQHPAFKGMIEKLDSAMELLTEFLQTLKPQLDAPASTDVNAIILSISRLLRAEAIRHGHEISFDLSKEIPTMIINPSQMIHLLYNMNFIAFKYMDVSGTVLIRSFMPDEHTLICSVISAAQENNVRQNGTQNGTQQNGTQQNSTLCAIHNMPSKEQERCPGIDQLSQVCRKIADDFGGRLEIRPHTGQGAEVSVTFTQPNL